MREYVAQIDGNLIRFRSKKDHRRALDTIILLPGASSVWKSVLEMEKKFNIVITNKSALKNALIQRNTELKRKFTL